MKGTECTKLGVSNGRVRLCFKRWVQYSLVLLLLTSSGSFAQQQQPAVPKVAVPQPAPGDAKTQAQPAAPIKAAPGDDISVEQARLADRFKRLEEVVGRLAELSASSDPRRAKLLRDAIAQSREQDVNARFGAIVKLLEDERLSAAATNQVELQKELDALLGLLLKADRDKELASQRERVHKYLKELERLIRLQRGVRARIEGGDELPGLNKDQQRIALDTGKLNGDIAKNEGNKKTSSSEPKQEDASPESTPGDNPKQSNQGGAKKKEQDPNKSNSPEKSSKSGEDKQPSKSKPGESSKSQTPSQSGKPPAADKSQPKSADGQSSNGKPSKSKNSPPSNSPPTPGQPNSDPPKGDDNDAPKDPQNPADRATNRLRAAQQQMDNARKKLEESLRKPAAESQRQAVKELEQAKAELERILRQLREEETERVLTQLAARFRKMLEMQTAVYEATVKLDRVPEGQRTHDHEIEAARQSRQESSIVHEVDKALLVLHEEGSSVAFPEAIEQMRDDMRQITERLAALKVERVTQGLEKDVITALEETIAALEKAIKNNEKKRTPPGQQQGMAGKPDDMSLVDKIAELKM